MAVMVVGVWDRRSGGLTPSGAVNNIIEDLSLSLLKILFVFCLSEYRICSIYCTVHLVLFKTASKMHVQ